MVEYESVCYLDMQKTGSTFVQAFLAAHMNEPLIAFKKHGRVRDAGESARFCFVTCRRPMELYLSLFSSGCDGKGALRRRMTRAGRDGLYERTQDGFARWLAFMLEPANAAVLGERYAEADVRLYGFQTHRFLSLALPKDDNKLARASTPERLRRLFDRKKIPSAALRTERLSEGLAALARDELRPHLKDLDAALLALGQARPLNASSRDDRATAFDIPDDLVRLVEEREWLLHEVMGYARAGDGPEAQAAEAARPAVIRFA